MTNIPILIFGIFLMLFSCRQSNSHRQENHSIQQQADPCDNPDADIACCFINMPAELTSTMNITGQNEPGDKLNISGIVYKEDGKTPFPNVILYAYHTDSKGYYSKSGSETGVQKWQGRLHGWCKTDKNGAYQIHTIRPARYPDNSMPAHIHAAIKKDNGQMVWISDFVLKDDSLVDEKYLSSYGEGGVMEVKKNTGNTWTGDRDIVLK